MLLTVQLLEEEISLILKHLVISVFVCLILYIFLCTFRSMVIKCIC